MEYNGRHERHNRMAQVMLAALLGKVMGAEIDDEALYRACMCEFCAKGVPLVNDKHVILGAEIPCDAAK